MTASTTNTETDALLAIDVDTDLGIHDEAAKVSAIHWAVSVTLEALHESLAADDPPDVAQADIDVLEAAFRTGQRLLDHPDYEAFLDGGLAALPDDVAADVDETIVPLAPVYDVDLERSAPADGLDGATAAVVDTVRTTDGWRGS